MDLAIRTSGLVKRYPPDVLAVDGLDLEVRAGECFGLLGPNGAPRMTRGGAAAGGVTGKRPSSRPSLRDP